ncbi:MAG: hypothetical protein ACPGVU_25090 [Limisphaerales bacterium]
MTARASQQPPTRVFLVERVEQLANKIEDSLHQMGDRIGFERTTNVSSAARDLAYIDPDVVVINIDEMDTCEWNTLAKLREVYPRLRFYGLSDNPKSNLPTTEVAEACHLPLVSSLDQLKQELSAARAV